MEAAAPRLTSQQKLSSEAAGEIGVQSSPAQGMEYRAKAGNCVCAKEGEVTGESRRP